MTVKINKHVSNYRIIKVQINDKNNFENFAFWCKIKKARVKEKDTWKIKKNILGVLKVKHNIPKSMHSDRSKYYWEYTAFIGHMEETDISGTMKLKELK